MPVQHDTDKCVVSQLVLDNKMVNTDKFQSDPTTQVSFVSYQNRLSSLAYLCWKCHSSILTYWEAEAFPWDHWCDDETPPARTTNSLKFFSGTETAVHLHGCNSRQAHYAALALFTWNLDRARGTKATVAVWWFFSWASKPMCGATAAMAVVKFPPCILTNLLSISSDTLSWNQLGLPRSGCNRLCTWCQSV